MAIVRRGLANLFVFCLGLAVVAMPLKFATAQVAVPIPLNLPPPSSPPPPAQLPPRPPVYVPAPPGYYQSYPYPPYGYYGPVAPGVVVPDPGPVVVRERPNVVTAELGGRALEYSIDYDRGITSFINLGLGISHWNDDRWWTGKRASILVIPFYGNYYFSDEASRGFVTVGVDAISVSQSDYGDGTFENTGAAGVFGGGFEERSARGLLFRFSGYVIEGRSTNISLGVSIGGAF